MKLNTKVFPNRLRQVFATLLLLQLTWGFLAWAIFLPTSVSAEINQQINYQGFLTDSSGSVVDDGNYNMEFKLYTASTGGSALWTETLTTSNRVSITDGNFSVMLGEVESLANVDFNQTLYLGVNIGGTGDTPTWDGEMTPRKIIGAVPAAFEAKKLGGLLPTSFLRSDIANDRATITNATTTNLYTSLFNAVSGLFTSLTADTVSVTTGLSVSGNATTSGYLTIGSAPTGAHYTSGSLNIQNYLVVPYASTTAVTVSGETYLNNLTVSGTSTFSGLISGAGFSTAFDNRISGTWRGQANGLASLGADGKVPDEQLSPLAISDTNVVDSEAEMLALTGAQIGDVAIRTDINTSYILRAADPTILSSWAELLSPTDAVISVNGHRGAVTLSTDDIDEGLTNLYFTNTRFDDRINSTWRGKVNGLASLGADGKIPSSQLNALPINNTYVVSSELAMLATGASKGDIAVRTDENKTYVLQGDDPTVLGNWVEIAASASVTSVNGKTGIVTLTTTDITEGTGLYWTTDRFNSALASATTWTGDLYIDGGSLGIGIPTPTNALDVLGNASTSGHVYVGDSLYVGSSNGSNNDVIYFRSGLESLAWSSTNSRFEISTALFAPISYATSSLIDTLSLGGGLTSTLLSTNANGQVVATSSAVIVSGYLTSSTTLPAFLNYWTKSGSTLSYTEGSIGLGTASPSGLFEIATSTADNILVVSNTSGFLGLGLEPTYRLDVLGSARFGLDNEKIGLGTTGSNILDYDSETSFIIAGDGSLITRIDADNDDATSSWGIQNYDQYIFRVDSSGNASSTGIFTATYLGAGTTSPFATLSVAGNSYLGGNVTATGTIYANRGTYAAPTNGLLGGNGDRFILGAGDGSSVPYSFGLNTNELWSSIPTSAFYSWYIGAAEKMRLSADGYLGIGTTSPYAPLSVSGQVVAASYVGTTTATSTLGGGMDISSGCFSINGVCISGGGEGTINSGTTGQIAYYAADGDTLTATSSVFLSTAGYLGLGTSDPSSRLTIAQETNVQAAGIRLESAETMTARGEWTQRTDSPELYWNAVASSANGRRLAAAASSYGLDGSDSLIYTSNDSGLTWNLRLSAWARNWSSITSSADGLKLAASVYGGYIYTSTDGGATWTERAASLNWVSITSSSDGTKLAALRASSYVYTSSNSGVTWTHQTGSGVRSWTDIDISNDGTKVVAVASGGEYVMTSTDGGVNWTEQTGSGARNWRSVACDSTCTNIAAVVSSGYIYTSTDSGVTWTEQTGSGSHVWQTIASSDDGTKLVASINDENVSTNLVYLSTDSGVTWVAQNMSKWVSTDALAMSSDGTKIVAGTYGGHWDDCGIFCWDFIYDQSNIYTLNTGSTYTARNFYIDNNDVFHISGFTESTTTDHLVIDSLGRVGMGTDAPNATLTVRSSTTGAVVLQNWLAADDGVVASVSKDASDNGAFSLYDGSGNIKIKLDSASDSYFTGGYLGLGTTSPSAPLTVWGSGTGATNLANFVNSASSSLLTILNNGYIGIGTSSPSTTLQISGSRPMLTLSDSSAGLNSKHWFISPQGGNLYFGTSSDANMSATTTHLSILSDGNVGIGTSSPSSRLEVVGASGNTGVLFKVTSLNSSSQATERFVVNGEGRVGVGTTTLAGMLNIAQSENSRLGGLYLSSSRYSDWVVQVSAGSRVWSSIASSDDGLKLAAAVSSGYIYTSTDGGTTWTERTTSGSRSWSAITSSADGLKLAATDRGGYIYTSTDGGTTWTTRTGSGTRTWSSISSSSDGTKLIATDAGTFLGATGYVYTSTDSGATWTARTGAGLRWWTSASSSSDGTKLVAVTLAGNIYTSSNSGSTWTARTGPGSQIWTSTGMSGDGTKLIAIAGWVEGPYYVYVSTDSGVNWTLQNLSTSVKFNRSYISRDGSKWAISATNNYIYISAGGSSWIAQEAAGARVWSGLALSSNGNRLFATVNGGYIYTYPRSSTSVYPDSSSRSMFIDSFGHLRFTRNDINLLSISQNGAMSLSGDPTEGVSLALASTSQSSTTNAYGLYTGGLTLAPTSTYSAYFISSGGTVQATTSFALSAAYNLYASPMVKSGSGTITNSYGLYVATSSLASNNYGAYIGDRVGVGTTTPYSILHISSTTPMLTISDTSAGTDAKHWFLTSNNGQFKIGTTSDSLSATTSILTITTAGNLGVGTTTAAQKLTVEGSAQFSAVGSLAAANDLRITADGTLTTDTSDERLKTNVTSLTGMLDKVLMLQGVSFNWASDPTGRTEIGLLAQKVEPIIPEVVFTNSADNYKGINYSRLVTVLIEAVKEQNTKITTLENNYLATLSAGSGSLPLTGTAGLDLANVRSITSVSGAWSIDGEGILIVKRLEADEVIVANGVTFKDQTTGEDVCVYVEEGRVKNRPGSCSGSEETDGGTAIPIPKDPEENPSGESLVEESATTTEDNSTGSEVREKEEAPIATDKPPQEQENEQDGEIESTQIDGRPSPEAESQANNGGGEANGQSEGVVSSGSDGAVAGETAPTETSSTESSGSSS